MNAKQIIIVAFIRNCIRVNTVIANNPNIQKNIKYCGNAIT